jgi:hypothetical protein
MRLRLPKLLLFVCFAFLLTNNAEAQIQVTVYEDVNGNGVKGVGEPGISIPNPILYFDSNGDGTCETNTMIIPTEPVPGTYNYDITPFGDGNYQVEFVTMSAGYNILTPETGLSPVFTYPAASTASAGYYQPVSISGEVFHDINGNGQNNELIDIPVSVSISLENTTSGDTYGPVNTSGVFSFDDLPPGNYVMTFPTNPGNMVLTFKDIGANDTDSDADRITGETAVIVVNSGDADITNIGAGYYVPVTIGNYAWEDMNGNGIQDAGEPPYPGLAVTLTGNDGTGTPIAPLNDITDGGGNYLFENLAPGTYTVTFGPLGANFFFSDRDETNDDEDSDPINIAPGVIGQCPPITVISEDEIDHIDAGVYEAVTIGDLVWEDTNGDGIQDAGEPPLNGIQVSIRREDNQPFTRADGSPANPVVSGPAGAYEFDLLKPGSYILTFGTLTDYYRTKVTNGAPDANDDSDADQTTGDTEVVEVESGDENEDIDAGYYKSCKIGDFTWIDNDGDGIQNDGTSLGGVNVTIEDEDGNPVTNVLGAPVAAQVTNGSGNYLFENLPPGNYIITFTPPAGYFPTRNNAGGEPDNNDVGDDSDLDQGNGNMTFIIEMESDDMNLNIDAGFYQPVTIGNMVWHDADADGIQDGDDSGGVGGVTIILENADGSALTDVNNNAVANQVTDASGMYEFENIRPGTYTMRVQPPGGWQFSDPDETGDDLDSDFSDTGNLVTDLEIETGETVDNIDAGIFKNIELSGTIWLEGDMNSMLDGGESGIADIQMTFTEQNTGASRQTTSGADGLYEISIRPGDYIVSIDAINLSQGGPLFGLESCDGQEDADNDVDNDDNGAGTGPVISTVIQLRCGQEPENMGVANSTVDFCFSYDCNSQNTLAAPSCEQVQDTLCDLNVLDVGCARMPSPPLVGPAPSPLCEGQGVPHNMSWFAFVAGNGDYTIQVIPFACTAPQGQAGIQAGVYTDCTFSESVYCAAQPCINPNQPVNIISELLTPGNTYFFWLDGCSASECSYEVNILGNFEQFTIPDPSALECTSPMVCDTVCPNSEVTVKVNQGFDFLTLRYFWKVIRPDGSVQLFETDENQLTYETGSQLGTYRIMIYEIRNKCDVSFEEVYYDVVVANPADEDFGLKRLCPEDLEEYTGPDVDANGNPNPNGDNESGWREDGFDFQVGNNEATIVEGGCVYKQKVNIQLFNSSPFTVIDTLVCADELPLNFGCGIIDLEGLGWEIYCQDVNGCDSTLIVNVTVLDVEGGSFSEQICVGGGHKLTFSGYTVLTSGDLPGAPPLSHTIRWRNSAGNIINDGDPDGLPNTVIVPQAGVYTIEFVYQIGNKQCVFPIDYELILNIVPPVTPTATADWENAFCKTSNSFTYTVTSTSANVEYKWTYPAGLAVSGQNSPSLTVNWGESTGGTICVTVSDICSTSNPYCETFVITPYPESAFKLEEEICITDQARVIYTLTDKPGYQYTWNLDGGTIIAAPGSNNRDSLIVEWNDAGTKTVSLIVSENGCASAPFSKQIDIVDVLPEPEIVCTPEADQVVFDWSALTDQNGPAQVTVLTGQTGTLNGNQYTITGLTPGTTVKIEVLFPMDHICGNLTGTEECITQNCVPEAISLDNVPAICLTSSTPVIDLKALSNSITTDGTFKYTGPGVTDQVLGIFDPKVAGPGKHRVRFDYTSLLGCISAPAFRDIDVFATPTSLFVVDDRICQDSTSLIDYTGSITSGGSYTWNFGPVGDVKNAGTGPGPFNVGWNTPGSKTITLTTSKDGCPSTPTTRTVNVDPRIEPISITCPTRGATTITFDWNDVANLSGVQIKVNGVNQPAPPTSMLTLTGLSVLTDYTLEVTGISNNACPGVKQTLTCKTLDCPPVSLKFSIPDTTLCATPGAPFVNIDVTVTGGLQSPNQKLTWSGPGITQVGNSARFNRNIAGVGTHSIKISLEDGTCKKDTTMKITVIGKPTSTFTGKDLICITDNYIATFTGTPNLPLNWNSPAGVNINRVGTTNDYRVTFPANGTYTLGLVVGNPGCLSDPTSKSVKVDPELVPVVIDCQPTTSSVNFTWNDIDCASEYEVRINSVLKGKQTALSYLASGLMVGEKVEIEIRPISTCACPAIPTTKVCEAKQCPGVKLALSTPVSSYCEGSQTTPVTLNVNTTGSGGTGTGSWSGPDISAAGVFSAAGKAPGLYEFFYKFTEEGCTYLDSITIEVFERPSVAVVNQQPDCYQDNTGSIEVTTTKGTAPYRYDLNNNRINPPLGGLAPGNYTLTVIDDNDCRDTKTFTIVPALEPSVTITGLSQINKGNSAELRANFSGAGISLDSLVWTDKAGNVICRGLNCDKVSVAPTSDETYCVKVYFNSGCNVEACFDVDVLVVIDISIPNVVSFEGNNPFFFVQQYENINIIKSMKIYDRWGNKVFEKENVAPGDPTQGWNGRYSGGRVTPGVYIYSIEVELKDGKTRLFTGDVTVL